MTRATRIELTGGRNHFDSIKAQSEHDAAVPDGVATVHLKVIDSNVQR
jgi:hypothetical protein